jgi:hypothetical protein
MAGQRTIDDVIDGGQGGLANVYAGYYHHCYASLDPVVGGAQAGAGGAGGTASMCGAGGGAYFEGLGPVSSAINATTGGAGGTSTSGGAGGGSYICLYGGGGSYGYRSYGYGEPHSSSTGNW